MAAEQGFRGSQCNLGLSYIQGIGVQQNYTEGMKWFQKAAEQGDPFAQYNLALEGYARGHGVPKNQLEAFVWFSLAAANGYKDAIQGCDIGRTLLSPKELQQAKLRVQKLQAEIEARTAKKQSFATP